MDIAVENLGAVPNFKGTLPPAGVYVFKGRNGSGKTTLLNAVGTAMGGADPVPVRDRAEKARLQFGEVTMTVGARRSIKGELSVVGLSGRFSIADLVDPGIAKPESADAARIKALVSIAQVEPSLEHFAGLVPGGLPELEKLVSKPGENDDLVAIAARVKRDLEAKARAAADAATHAEGHAAGCREAIKGVDLLGPCSEIVLDADLVKATTENGALVAKAKERTAALSLAAEARKQLEAAPACDLEAAWEELEAKNQERIDADRMRSMAKAEMDGAAIKYKERCDAATAAVTAFAAAERAAIAIKSQQAALDGWRKSIEAAEAIEPVSDELLEASLKRAMKASQAVKDGETIRRAIQQDNTRQRHEKDATAWREVAEGLRESAKRTDDVLSSVVAKTGTKLRVEAGRLKLDTPRGPTLFAELSAGEKYRLAIDLAVDAVGAAGLLHLPQEAWEGLDPVNRDAIHDHAKLRGVRILTAEADGGELRGEAYQPEAVAQ